MSFLRAAVFALFVLPFGCKHTPSCEDAVDSAARFDSNFATKDGRFNAVHSCRDDHWPTDLLNCYQDATDATSYASCNSKKVDRSPATLDDCIHVRDHMVDLMLDDYLAHPDTLWDDLHQGGAAVDGLPAMVTKPTFAQFLATDAGKAWTAERRQRGKTGPDQHATDACTKHATKSYIECALAAKNTADAGKCDRQ